MEDASDVLTEAIVSRQPIEVVLPMIQAIEGDLINSDRGGERITPLIAAASQSMDSPYRMQVLEALLEHPNIDVNKQVNGGSALHHAIVMGNLPGVLRLLQVPGIDVNLIGTETPEEGGEPTTRRPLDFVELIGRRQAHNKEPIRAALLERGAVKYAPPSSGGKHRRRKTRKGKPSRKARKSRRRTSRHI